MKHLLWILILLPILAQAEHHRGHATEFLAEAIAWQAKVRTEWDRFLSLYQCAGTVSECEKNVDFIDRINRNMANTEIKQAQVLTLLPAGDLDDIRELVSQPRPAGTQAILMHVNRVSYFGARLLQHNATPVKPLRQVIARNSLVWSSMDFVSWHVTDAIREEIYMDPAFQ